jgi:hypothetical protein
MTITGSSSESYGAETDGVGVIMRQKIALIFWITNTVVTDGWDMAYGYFSLDRATEKAEKIKTEFPKY